MKLDFSTLLLVILCVIPGLFAQRSRNSVSPKSFDDQGAAAELGELVALGVSTHGLLICLVAVLMSLLGFALHLQVGYFFWKLDALHGTGWMDRHGAESILFITLYVFVSFAVSHWLGIFYGVWSQGTTFTERILARSTWLRRRGITGLLGEAPIIYETLNPLITDDGEPYLVFLKIEMKDSHGFYSGQLSQFAIVRDEEPHRPVYLINAYFTKDLAVPYAEVLADGVMLDLADAVTVQVRQQAPQEIAAEAMTE